MRKSSIIASVAAAAALLAVASAAGASTVRARSEASLSLRADHIALGRVVSVSHHRGWRHLSLEVVDSVKGARNGQLVRMVVPGGRMPDGTVRHVSGVPEVAVGQYWLTFAAKKRGAQVPLGMGFGMMRAQRAKDGSFVLSRSLRGLALVDQRGRDLSKAPYVLDRVPYLGVRSRVLNHLASEHPAGGKQ